MAKGGRAKERFRERQLVNRLNAEYTALRNVNPNATAEQLFAMQRGQQAGATPAATTTAQANEYANATVAPAWAQNVIAGPFNSAINAMTQPTTGNPPGVVRFEDGSMQQTFEDGSFRNLPRPGFPAGPQAGQPLQWWQYAQQAQQTKTAQGGGSKARYSQVPTPTPNQPQAETPKVPAWMTWLRGVLGTGTQSYGGSYNPTTANGNTPTPYVPKWIQPGVPSYGGSYNPTVPAAREEKTISSSVVGTGTGSTGAPGIVQGRTPNPNTGIPDFPMLAGLGEAPATGSAWYSNNWKRRKKGGGGYKQWQPQQRPAYEPREPFIPGPGLSNWSIG